LSGGAQIPFSEKAIGLSDNYSCFLDHKTVVEVIDPSHFDGIVFSNFIANINTDFAGLAPVYRNIGGLVRVTVIDTVGFRAKGCAQRTGFGGTNFFVNFSNVIHGYSKK
jgi:hypothetical protein